MVGEPHIEPQRLEELSRAAIIADEAEVRHLRNCVQCQELLRFFVQELRNARIDPTSREASKRPA
jgi:hypothetical protein